MSDTPAPILPTTNRQIAVDQGKLGFGKIAAGFLACGVSTYVMNQLSLHGVNFEEDIIPGVKLSSEIVKSALEGTLVSLFVGMTPSHFVAFVKDGIVFVKQTWRTWKSAWTDTE